MLNSQGVYILQGQSTEGESVPFRVREPEQFVSNRNAPMLSIFGTLSNLANNVFDLQHQAKDGLWYTCNEPIFATAKLGLYTLPINDYVILRFKFTPGDSNSSLSAVIYGCEPYLV
jgi:hypothetical protein